VQRAPSTLLPTTGEAAEMPDPTVSLLLSSCSYFLKKFLTDKATAGSGA